MRLLHAARLSRLGDASTGLDKQDSAAVRYADGFGHQIVAVAADTDVSGSTRPQDRPKLGPWLTNPALMAQYDGIVASHLDRLGRNVRHLTELYEWAEQNNKTIITVEPNIDWSNDVGKLIWGIMSWLAEQELKAITRRSVDTQAYLIEGGYLVGAVPYGFRAVPVPGSNPRGKEDHKTLEPDPDLVHVLEGMVSRAIEGKSLVEICKWLDKTAPTTHGEIWHPRSVRHILRNEALIGRRNQSVEDKATGKTVKGVLKFKGVIDVATWKSLQAALDARSFTKGAVSEAPSMLTGSLFCAKCGRVMHRKLRTVQRKRTNDSYVIASYRCSGTAREPSTCKNMVSLPDLHSFVDELFTTYALANAQIVQTVLTPGNGHQDELEQNARDVAELDIDSDDYMEKLQAYMVERKRLQALPAEPDRIEQRPIGVVRDRWLTLKEADKRQLLMDSGIRIEAVKTSSATTEKVPTIGSRLPGESVVVAFSEVYEGIQVNVYYPADISAKVTGSIVMTRPTVAV